uniref:Probable inactive purple acid phosphatase 1 isoform X2 n=1 Tax=Tanacetum cinerariifolium TaxID=118510 RepID=A0A699RG25_TANCI|nr:probable inactive purple acid phosphatase 1 isoform X2 [Tanacetum cinerariifolium]
MVLGKRFVFTLSNFLATVNVVEPIPYFSSVLKGVSRLNNNEPHLMVFQITMSAVREWATSHGSKLFEMTVTLTSGYGIIEAQSFVDWGRREGEKKHSSAKTFTFYLLSMCDM